MNEFDLVNVNPTCWIGWLAAISVMLTRAKDLHEFLYSVHSWWRQQCICEKKLWHFQQWWIHIEFWYLIPGCLLKNVTCLRWTDIQFIVLWSIKLTRNLARLTWHRLYLGYWVALTRTGAFCPIFGRPACSTRNSVQLGLILQLAILFL